MKKLRIALLGTFLAVVGCLGLRNPAVSQERSAAPTRPALDGTNGAPSYAWGYTGTDAVSTPVAPFNKLTPAGTVVQDTVLSHGYLARITDPNDSCGYLNSGDWLFSISGGSNDRPINTNGTILQVRCTGGASEFVGFNPFTLRRSTILSTDACIGMGGFSQVHSNIFYCKPQAKVMTPLGTANGASVYKLVWPFSPTDTGCGLSAGSCPDVTQKATWSLLLDFSSCPQAPAGTPISYSILGIGPGDAYFTSDISWTGGQNTARYEFAYVPSAGCQTVDSQGNGTNALWYAAGSNNGVSLVNTLTGTPLQATWFIHDSYTNGSYVQISGPSSQGPLLWQLGTPNVIPTWTIAGASGHNTFTKTFFVSAPWPVAARSLALPATQITLGQPQTPGCTTCMDDHFSGDMFSDVNPIIGTNGGAGSEIWGMPLVAGATAIRFGKTYSGCLSNCHMDVVGEPSPDRRLFCFASDMQGQLGTIKVGSALVPRTDVFCFGLAGQGASYTPPTK